MKIKIVLLQLAAAVLIVGCNGTDSRSAQANNDSGFAIEKSDISDQLGNPDSGADKSSNSANSGDLQSKEPQTVMDYFALLPDKYFMLEGCFREDDKDCSKARSEYLKNYKEIEDIRNGYLKAGCDGGQRCIEMALFKRPDNTYVVAVATFGEMMDENYFLDYQNGSWTDISQKIVPEYSKDKRYEIPRVGTTVKVFSTKLIEKVEDIDIREKDKKIYDLEWKDGRFVKKK